MISTYDLNLGNSFKNFYEIESTGGFGSDKSISVGFIFRKLKLKYRTKLSNPGTKRIFVVYAHIISLSKQIFFLVSQYFPLVSTKTPLGRSRMLL